MGEAAEEGGLDEIPAPPPMIHRCASRRSTRRDSGAATGDTDEDENGRPAPPRPPQTRRCRGRRGVDVRAAVVLSLGLLRIVVMSGDPTRGRVVQ